MYLSVSERKFGGLRRHIGQNPPSSVGKVLALGELKLVFDDFRFTRPMVQSRAF